MKRLLPLLTAASLTVFTAMAPLTAAAQDASPFAPRLVINDRAISNYEVAQRKLFMQLLRAPGDPDTMALEALIEDRLRMQEAKRLGLTVAPEALQKGMDEFAARANLSAEQFIGALGQAGVEPQTFRDFVEAGLVWRDVVRAKFGPTASISEAEIDRAIEGETRKAALRVLISELIIPAPPGREAEVLALAQDIQSNVSSEGGFSAAVANYSAAPSRARGGRMDWMPLADLPAAIGPLVLALAPGEVSDPLPIPGGVALFQLRGLEDIPGGAAPDSVSVEYAQVTLPNDATSAALLAQLQSRADACNDIYGIAEGLPESQHQRLTQSMAEVPADIGLALARLDKGEQAVLSRGGAQVMLMLCARTPVMEAPPVREDIRRNLLNTMLEGQANLYLKELRANAIIREP